jgi:hypothetical protein
MPFFELQPFTSAEVTYVVPEDVYLVTVTGNAPKITSGIVIDEISSPPHIVVEVMGWTGPLERGTEQYTVHARLRGPREKTILVRGKGREETVPAHILVSESPVTV